jgi:hypothetical protein
MERSFNKVYQLADDDEFGVGAGLELLGGVANGAGGMGKGGQDTGVGENATEDTGPDSTDNLFVPEYEFSVNPLVVSLTPEFREDHNVVRQVFSDSFLF